MPVLEVDIEDAVVKWAKKRRFLTPKVKFVEAGYPDRLFVSPYGHTIFIEFKKPGEQPSAIQNHRLEELRKRGIPATWCDSVHEAITILNAALETSLGTPPISDEGDKTTVIAGVSRTLSGPGLGKDINSAGGIQNLEIQRAGEPNADYSAKTPRSEDVAGRDQEVGRILLLDVHDPARGLKRP